MFFHIDLLFLLNDCIQSKVRFYTCKNETHPIKRGLGQQFLLISDSNSG